MVKSLRKSRIRGSVVFLRAIRCDRSSTVLSNFISVAVFHINKVGILLKLDIYVILSVYVTEDNMFLSLTYDQYQGYWSVIYIMG